MIPTIGIPKALLYYKYKDLWISFFEELGCNIIISPNTNQNILNDGIKTSIDEACLPMKIYLGHIKYLINKCDYILIPRIKSLKKHEKLCTNFSACFDLVSNLFNTNILNYNIDVEKHEDELYSFVSLGLELGYNYRKSVNAYRNAKKKEEMLNKRRINKQKSLIASSNKTKILIAGHPYNIYDDKIGKKVTDLLKENNIDIIYSDIYDKKYLDKEVEKITKRNYWTYNKEIIGSISHYKDNVDGIILITAFPCGPDSLSNEMIERNIDTPIINLIIDDSEASAGLETRIESFIDILEERKKVYGRKSN